MQIRNGVLTTDLDANSFKIIRLAPPIASTDAANKAYVDSHSGGGGGPGPSLNSLQLIVPTDLFTSPVVFDVSTSDVTGTLTKAAAPGSTVYANQSGLAAPPAFITFTTLKSLMSLNLVENTKLSTWAGSTSITTLGTVTTGSFPAANLSGSIATAQIANNAVTYAKMQTVAGSRLLGNSNTTPGA